MMPGKFEGEASYAQHFYETWLDGGTSDNEHERDGMLISEWEVTAEDVRKFPELKGRGRVAFYESEDGFWTEVDPEGEVGGSKRGRKGKSKRHSTSVEGCGDEVGAMTPELFAAMESAKKKVLATEGEVRGVRFDTVKLFPLEGRGKDFVFNVSLRRAHLGSDEHMFLGAFIAKRPIDAEKKAFDALRKRLGFKKKG